MRKFTIFCPNRKYPTVAFLLLLLTMVAFGCSNNYKDPTPQNAALYGAWQENVIYNYNYENNVMVKIDTLPVMTNKGTMYTVFKHDGTFEAYEVNAANTIIDEINEPFNYYADKNLLQQSWPAPSSLTNVDKPNVGALSNGTYLFPSIPGQFGYTITVTANTIKLSSQIVQYGDISNGNYVVQVRQLTRWQ